MILFSILKDLATGETICTDSPDAEGENFYVIGQSSRPPRDKEIWDENISAWVYDAEADAEEAQREWNACHKTLRSKLFEMEVRVYMLEEALRGLERTQNP